MLRRTLLVYPFPALVVAALWVRLERPTEGGRALVLVAVALASALVRPVRARIAAALVAPIAAAWIAFGVPPLAEPGTIGSRFGTGFLDFYDVAVPFDPRVHAGMRGAILVAVFAFCLALAVAVSMRRSTVALLVLLVGAGWPATLLAGGDEIARGAAILLAALVLLAGLGRRPALRAAVPAALVLVLVAAAASTTSAVAKRELVSWQRWDFYTRPDAAVEVGYVWDSQWNGIRFPKKQTVVLRVQAPPTSLYWRATTLDDYVAGRWVEHVYPQHIPYTGADPLLPAAARDDARLITERVTVEALQDNHLVGGTFPVRFDAGSAPLVNTAYGVALLPGGLTRGLMYTVKSYAPQPKPAQLARVRPLYPAALTRFLEIDPNVPAPRFDAPGREQRLDALVAGRRTLQPYQPLAETARRVAGDAPSPYAAAARIESWLRSDGGFAYDEHPPLTTAPPLVGFVVQTKRGYCQYFAGAMALMLRYLGVPARVAVGFTSGTYDERSRTWTVTDHDAHAWVEVWFRGYGWLPFDPTPGRGSLSAPYSTGSLAFLGGAAGVLARTLGIMDPAQIKMNGDFRMPVLFGTQIPGGGGSASGRAGIGLLAVLGILAGSVVAGIVGTKLALRRVRYLTRDPRRVASACRHELSDFLLDQRIDAARSATLHELGRIVGHELSVDPRAFVAAASAARFGPPAAAPSAARRARHELRRLEALIRRRLSARERLRGLLSLRSLGVSS